MEETFNGKSKTKVCARCVEELPLHNFSTHNTSKDGLQSWCNRCNTLYNMLNREYKDVGGVKLCKKCRRFVPKSHFYTSQTHKDGLQCYCKDCDKEHGRLRNGTTGVYREAESRLSIHDYMLKMPVREIIDVLTERGCEGKISIKEDIEF